MKNISRTLAALAGLAFFTQGCNEKADENTFITNVTNPSGQPKVTYVIQVVDAAGNVEGRAAGVASANISYRNSAGARKIAVTDAAGNVVVTDVAPGSFSARFEATGYAAMDFTTDINPSNNALADSGKEYVASSRLYAIRSNAAVSGRVYGNYTNSSVTPVNPNATANRRSVNLRIVYNLVKTGANAYPMGSGTGRITDINIDPSTIAIQTADDDATRGDFSVTDLHATTSGYLTATLSMVPYVATIVDPIPSNSPSFVLPNGNSLNLTLGSAETLRLGNLLAVRQ